MKGYEDLEMKVFNSGLQGMLENVKHYISVYTKLQNVEEKENARAAAENREQASVALYFYNDSTPNLLRTPRKTNQECETKLLFLSLCLTILPEGLSSTYRIHLAN